MPGVKVSNTFSPAHRPGKDILLRASGEMGPTAVASRDLARYYALLEAATRRLRGRFSPAELEALAYALQSMALVEHPDLFYLAPEAVAEAERYEGLCAMAGIGDCQGFLGARPGPRARRGVGPGGCRGAVPGPAPGEAGQGAWEELGLL